MDQKAYSRAIIAASVIMILAVGAASAYTISRNRVIYSPDRNVSASAKLEQKLPAIPDRIVVDAAAIAWMLDCHAGEGGVGYQMGYDDACDDMRVRFGLRASKFRSGPSVMANIPAQKYSTMFPVNAYGYFPLNSSLYQFEYILNDSLVSFPKNQTIDEIRVYARRK